MSEGDSGTFVKMDSFRLMKCSECGKEVGLHRGETGSATLICPNCDEEMISKSGYDKISGEGI